MASARLAQSDRDADECADGEERRERVEAERQHDGHQQRDAGPGDAELIEVFQRAFFPTRSEARGADVAAFHFQIAECAEESPAAFARDHGLLFRVEEARCFARVHECFPGPANARPCEERGKGLELRACPAARARSDAAAFARRHRQRAVTLWAAQFVRGHRLRKDQQRREFTPRDERRRCLRKPRTTN